MTMKDKKKSKLLTVGYVVMLLFIVLVSMLFGTTIGYDRALKSLIGCEEVPCESLGLEGMVSCEICSKPTLAQIVIDGPSCVR